MREISWQELFNGSKDYDMIESLCGTTSNKKVAIFGSARAGAEAILFANLSRLSISCIIDDYSDEEFYCGVYPVIDRVTFKKEYALDVDLVLMGKHQNGLISTDEIGLPILKLSESY